MQQSLFDQGKDSFPAHKKVIRIKNHGAPLSKEQQAFNRLLRRIEKLQKQLEEDTTKMETLHKLFHQEVMPRVMELGGLKIQLCHLLDKKRKDVKLSNTQRDKLDDLIIDLLEDALSVIDPDEPTQQLYERYNHASFAETQQQAEEEAKDLFRHLMSQQMGLDIDPSLLTGEPDFEKISESLLQQLKEKDQSARRRLRIRTRKQEEKEAMEKRKDELKNKSLRSIYLSLAKLLHPDAELDEALKKEKEELMKEVTTAYTERDMMHLLRLEMQWVKTHENELASINADTLTIYLQLLKDQVKDLEAEREMLFTTPHFADVVQYRYETLMMAKACIRNEAAGYKELNDTIDNDIAALQKGNRDYAIIRDCINKYYDEPELPW